MTKVQVTRAQFNNWRDFREAESLLKTSNTDKIYQAVDILRLRRQGKEYGDIKALGYTEFQISTVCRLAGLGRGYRHEVL